MTRAIPMTLAVVAMVAILLGSPTPARAVGVDDVIFLLSLDVTEADIIKAIETDSSTFELTVEDVDRLRKGGATDDLIRYMLATRGKKNEAPAAPAKAETAAPQPTVAPTRAAPPSATAAPRPKASPAPATHRVRPRARREIPPLQAAAAEAATFEELLSLVGPPPAPGNTLRDTYSRECGPVSPVFNEFERHRCEAMTKDARAAAEQALHLALAPPRALVLAPYDFERRGFPATFLGHLGDAHGPGWLAVQPLLKCAGDAPYDAPSGLAPNGPSRPRCVRIAYQPPEKCWKKGTSPAGFGELMPGWLGKGDDGFVITDGMPDLEKAAAAWEADKDPAAPLTAREREFFIPVADLGLAERLRLQQGVVIQTVFIPHGEWSTSDWRRPGGKSRLWGLDADVLGLRVIDLPTRRIIYSDPPSTSEKVDWPCATAPKLSRGRTGRGAYAEPDPANEPVVCRLAPAGAPKPACW